MFGGLTRKREDRGREGKSKKERKRRQQMNGERKEEGKRDNASPN